jgi:hypothetical protein
VPVPPEGLEVAVYVIEPAPKSDGTVKATVAVELPVAVAVPIVGAPGTIAATVAVVLELAVTPDGAPELVALT